MRNRLAAFAVSLIAALHAAFAASAPGAGTEIGKLEGAAFRIDVPANWNHRLVVFFHGYAIAPVTYARGESPSPMFAPILAEGYAVVQSAYSRTGWAVEEGSADTERLRRYFVAHHGEPQRTFVMGMSMGGTLTAMTIETKPGDYDGALSLCGAIEPTDRFMQRAFALRAAFDHYFPGVLGPLVPVPADYRPDEAAVRRVDAALMANPRAAAALHALHGVADGDSLPSVLAFISYDIKELQQRSGGNPFGNADLVYTGSGDDVALNDGVRRYRADPRAAAYVARWYVPTGRLGKPLLALHDVGDPLVVASSAFEYAAIAARAGRADRFVQQYVPASGHCVFTPDEVGAAFDALVAWSAGGPRPVSGRQP